MLERDFLDRISPAVAAGKASILDMAGGGWSGGMDKVGLRIDGEGYFIVHGFPPTR
jgi:hypothetical protein